MATSISARHAGKTNLRTTPSAAMLLPHGRPSVRHGLQRAALPFEPQAFSTGGARIEDWAAKEATARSLRSHGSGARDDRRHPGLRASSLTRASAHRPCRPSDASLPNVRARRAISPNKNRCGRGLRHSLAGTVRQDGSTSASGLLGFGARWVRGGGRGRITTKDRSCDWGGLRGAAETAAT